MNRTTTWILYVLVDGRRKFFQGYYAGNNISWSPSWRNALTYSYDDLAAIAQRAGLSAYRIRPKKFFEQ